LWQDDTSATQHFVETYIALSLIYLVISLIVQKLFKVLENTLICLYLLYSDEDFSGNAPQNLFVLRALSVLNLYAPAFLGLFSALPNTLIITVVSVLAGLVIGIITALAHGNHCND
jgi:ABC-type amino acid transport system permease subunit